MKAAKHREAVAVTIPGMPSKQGPHPMTISQREECKRNPLHLETARASATTGTLELAALGEDVGLL